MLDGNDNCENDCQCSGLITDNFKINSGNNGTKRKQETALRSNYKLKMNPHSLDFNVSPQATKRRVLGEIGNFNSSPLINRLKNSPMQDMRSNSPSPLMNRIKKSPFQLNKQCKYSPNYCSPLKENSPMNISMMSPLMSPLISPLLNSPIIGTHSPLSSKLSHSTHKRSSKITKVLEDRTRFKMENKENCNASYLNKENCNASYLNKENCNASYLNKDNCNASYLNQDNCNASYVNKDNCSGSYLRKENCYLKFDLEEETRDCFGERLEGRESVDWASSKFQLDFTDAIPPKPFDIRVPEDSQDLDDLETLQDLETEFENESFEQCTKYEIISTDSPNVISQGRSTSRKISSKTFEFGAPLEDSEQSTSFNRPATRMLNFDDEDFEFTSPAVKKTVSVKKSLKFNETPTKGLRHERSDSSIGSMSMSPCSAKLRLFPSESTSMESGFVSELDEPFLEIDESNSPKILNFSELLSGQIKENIITDKNFHLKRVRRPFLGRSISLHPESGQLSVSPGEEKRKRECEEEESNKRMRSECDSDSPVQRLARPVLQRALSENNATIKSALARSALQSDLIGDYSAPHALPLAVGGPTDLRAISSDTLAALLRGDYGDRVTYQVIDCRYPYEYEGGHIISAHNLYTREQVQSLLEARPPHPASARPPHTASARPPHPASARPPHTASARPPHPASARPPHTASARPPHPASARPPHPASARPPHPASARPVLVFHCEYSIERGPTLCRHLRSMDRAHHRATYPSLTYPEVYLLVGGYRAFHRAHPELCAAAGGTGGYTPMTHPAHASALKYHRAGSARRPRKL